VEYLKRVALDSPIGTNRAMAITGLGRLRTVDASDVLTKALEDPFWLARFNAISAMRQARDEKFVEALVELYSEESQPEVRLEVIKALGAIGGELSLKTLFQTLLSARSRYQDEQVHAYLALRRLTGLSYNIYDLKNWQKTYDDRFSPDTEGAGS
jgi:HEAT repeat protein